MKHNILFIANPNSDIIDEKTAHVVIAECAEKYSFQWHLYFTEKDQTVSRIGNKIKSSKYTIVVAIGGDGTINQVASTMLNTKAEMGIIPGGSANGLAYNLNLPDNFTAALERILESKAQPFDVIKINDSLYSVHLCDVGINARTVKRFEKANSKGMLGYGKHMIKEMATRKKVFYFYLTTHNIKKRFKAEMLVIANAASYATGAVINPVGNTQDGRFEIIIIKPYPWWALLRLLGHIFRGKHGKLDYVKIYSTDEVTIQFFAPQDFQTDGEIHEGVTGIKATILPNALRIRY
jgi:diacylglycerol kinase (ATP)